ncbi:hypothetical protein [Frankia sp. QA3]|nr:hypothetical protein [Frankia sp. QA3]
MAVFVDFENLVLGAGRGLPGQAADPLPAPALTWTTTPPTRPRR